MPSNSLNKVVLTCTLCLALVATGCFCTVDQRSFSGLTSANPDGSKHRRARTHGEQRRASGRVRSGSNPEYFEGSNPGPCAGAAAISELQGQSQRRWRSTNPERHHCPEYKPACTLAGELHKNEALATKVNGAINLILTTVNTFAALIPENGVRAASQNTGARQLAVSGPKELKRQWNQQMCSTEAADSASISCPLQ